MSFYDQVVKEFNSYPHTVAKVAELLAKGDYVCVLLGDHESVTTTWDDSDISAVARKVELDPKEDGSFGYLCWEAGTTVDQPVVAGTIAITAHGANVEPRSASADERTPRVADLGTRTRHQLPSRCC